MLLSYYNNNKESFKVLKYVLFYKNHWVINHHVWPKYSFCLESFAIVLFNILEYKQKYESLLQYQAATIFQSLLTHGKQTHSLLRALSYSTGAVCQLLRVTLNQVAMHCNINHSLIYLSLCCDTWLKMLFNCKDKLYINNS